MRISLLWLGLMAASCSHVKDQTVDEHQNLAARHVEKANEESAKYDPNHPMRAAPRAPGTENFGIDPAFESWNPTEVHLAAADREMDQANQHLVAAKSLLTFEDQACAGMSAGERSSCPLLASSVGSVEWAKDGFKLTFKQPDAAAQTYRRLNCHLAYAVATGFDRPSCPLFVKGTTLKQGKDSVEFAGDTTEVANALRAQAVKVFQRPARTARSMQ
ncbi:MAG: hypothetical protein Q8L48_30855 [Archangium sp.]|nr:hypothetical protein [Archangium sp.]